MSSRKLKYLFVWGNLNNKGKTEYNRTQIMSKQGYFSVKVWISTTD
jgi:hypothetical protein